MIELIGSFATVGGAHEVAAERIAVILDRYQEQPSILDQQLEAMVMPLLLAVREVARKKAPRDMLPHACRVMYCLCKVRGFKTVVKFVPHEVADLEPLVQLLASLDAADHGAWQMAYALMVWLSMLVMVPFDLSIIDSSTIQPPPAPSAPVDISDDAAPAAPRKPLTLVASLERLAHTYLPSTGPARDAAAILLARLLTRPGLQPQLAEFITWGGRELAAGRAADEGAGIATCLMVGIYTTLANIFKLGHRSELLPQVCAHPVTTLSPPCSRHVSPPCVITTRHHGSCRCSASSPQTARRC